MGAPLREQLTLVASRLGLVGIARPVLVPFLTQRAMLLALVCFSTYFIPTAFGWHALPNQPLLDPWLRWDSEYYLLAAIEGYGPSVWRSPDAFFPLYPWLIRLFGLLLPLPIAALVVAHLSTVIALVCIYLLVREADDERTARRAVWVALLYPGAYFFAAAYAEPVCLAALTATVLAARRGRALTASVCAAATTLSRPVAGPCLALPYVGGWLLRSRQVKQFPWYLGGTVVGMGILGTMHKIASGDALAFLRVPHVALLGDRRVYHRSPEAWWKILYDEGIGTKLMGRLLNWGALGFLGAVTAHHLRRRNWEYALLCVLTVAIPLAFQRSLFDATSMLRYSLIAFPAYLTVARWTNSDDLSLGVLSGSFATQLLLAVVFASWRWAE